MIAFFSHRSYGRVDVLDGTFIVTDFWCINLLPMVPRRTHLVLSRAPTGECTSVTIPAHAASIVAGYVRPWGAFIAAGALVASLLSTTYPERLHAFAIFAVSASACAVAWLFIGRLGAEERARRAVYRQLTGTSVDPAWLPDERRQELGARLRADLGARAPALAHATYREAPAAAWEDVVSEPDVRDVEFLQQALVLSRIEWREADPARRARLERAGHEAWRKCRA